jgi:hypothetical protein
MPIDGFSLVGFVKEEQSAVAYLEQACVPPAGYTSQSLRKQWAEAQKRLRAPFPNAGNPDIQPIPDLRVNADQEVQRRADQEVQRS